MTKCAFEQKPHSLLYTFHLVNEKYAQTQQLSNHFWLRGSLGHHLSHLIQNIYPHILACLKDIFLKEVWAEMLNKDRNEGSFILVKRFSLFIKKWWKYRDKGINVSFQNGSIVINPLLAVTLTYFFTNTYYQVINLPIHIFLHKVQRARYDLLIKITIEELELDLNIL